MRLITKSYELIFRDRFHNRQILQHAVLMGRKDFGHRKLPVRLMFVLYAQNPGFEIPAIPLRLPVRQRRAVQPEPNCKV